MDFYTISVIAFVVVLAAVVYKDRKKFKRESILLLRRTQKGKKVLMRIGTTFPRFWKYLGYVSVATGFVVSVLGFKLLFDNVVNALITRSAAPSLALVLPSLTSEPVMGHGFLAVPFWYWIICLGFLAAIHEGFHGIFTAFEKVRIKSMGIGLFAVIPLAFVEPDEKQLARKGVWPQLRVYSAGSFANFLLGGLSLILIIAVGNSAYASAGVDFQTYHFARVDSSAVTFVGGQPVSSPQGIETILSGINENMTVEVEAGNESFFIKNIYLMEQFAAGVPEQLTLFMDYPAARAGIEGTIVRIGSHDIEGPSDLSDALEDIGPGTETQVVAVMDGSEKTYTMTFSERPGSAEFVPDAFTTFFVSLEHVIPGSIGFYQTTSESFGSLVGQDISMSWSYIKHKVLFWEWIYENYPGLGERASENLAYWNGMLSDRNEPGYMGIVNTMPHMEIRSGLVAASGFIAFIQGLLVFMFMINVGVGIVNLLPIKPLDGGRMWDVVLRKYLPGRGPAIMRAVGMITLLLIILNFIPFGAIL